jgi:hypothetical protein
MGVFYVLAMALESSERTADMSGCQRQDKLAVGEDLFRESCVAWRLVGSRFVDRYRVWTADDHGVSGT